MCTKASTRTLKTSLLSITVFRSSYTFSMLEKISINNSISVFPCANIPDILVLHKGPLCKWCQEFSLRKLTEMLKVTTPVTPMH